MNIIAFFIIYVLTFVYNSYFIVKFFLLLIHFLDVRCFIKGKTDTYLFCTTIITYFWTLYFNCINNFKNFYNCFFKDTSNLNINRQNF